MYKVSGLAYLETVKEEYKVLSMQSIQHTIKTHTLLNRRTDERAH